VVLVADVMALLPSEEGNHLNEDGSPVWYQGDMPDNETAEMNVFLVSGGRWRVQSDLNTDTPRKTQRLRLGFLLSEADSYMLATRYKTRYWWLHDDQRKKAHY